MIHSAVSVTVKAITNKTGMLGKKMQNASSIFKRIENYFYSAILVYQLHH